jgi:ribosomal protein L17
MKAEKTYRVKKTRSGMSGSRETIFEGTLDHLKSSVFGYTIECGHSWNHKINSNPKTIKALIKAVNSSYNETEGGYTRSYVELID